MVFHPAAPPTQPSRHSRLGRDSPFWAGAGLVLQHADRSGRPRNCASRWGGALPSAAPAFPRRSPDPAVTRTIHTLPSTYGVGMSKYPPNWNEAFLPVLRFPIKSHKTTCLYQKSLYAGGGSIKTQNYLTRARRCSPPESSLENIELSEVRWATEHNIILYIYHRRGYFGHKRVR
jgi:hypothetical protein